jgi:CelD/BcsL family acetyltransferase involved in cellulose biosynthesis
VTGLAIREHHDAAVLPGELLEGWRGLAAEAGLPFADPAWMLAFWRHVHAPTAALRIVSVWDGGRPLGVGPFYGGDGPLGLSDHYLLAAGMGTRTGPLAAPGAESEVGQALAATLGSSSPRPSALMLDALDASSAWPGRLADGWPGRRPVHVSRIAPAYVARTGETMDAWLASRGRKFRERLRRTRRRVKARGGTVVRAQGREQVAVGLEALFALHLAWFAAAGRPSSLSDPAYRAAVTEAALEHPGARLWLIEADGRPVAANLAFAAGDRVCGWTAGIDPAWRDTSAGFLLLAEVLRDTHELGAAYFDLGAGDAPHKRRLADVEQPLAWSALLVRDRRFPLVVARRGWRRTRDLAGAAARRVSAR